MRRAGFFGGVMAAIFAAPPITAAAHALALAPKPHAQAWSVGVRVFDRDSDPERVSAIEEMTAQLRSVQLTPQEAYDHIVMLAQRVRCEPRDGDRIRALQVDVKAVEALPSRFFLADIRAGKSVETS